MRVSASNSKIILACFILFALAAPLRFVNLGYSEFQDDEKKAILKPLEGETVREFLLKQRKGPIQWFVTAIPLIITQDDKNEFAQRLPFALLNVGSVFILFFLVKDITKNPYAAIASALLYLVNGFIIGFGRISQYQSLNLFFSLLALLLYSRAFIYKNKPLVFSLAGTLSFCISLLSHWDAIYVAIPAVALLTHFLLNKDIQKDTKTLVLLTNYLLALYVLSPFMLPYQRHLRDNNVNKTYFERRMTVNSTYSLEKHISIIKLYNPFLFLEAVMILGLLSLMFIRKSWVTALTVIFNFILIKYFMAKPGTHIYNYVVPAIILAGIGVGELYKNIWRFLKPLVALLFLLLIAFLYYQSYIIFVDNTNEYPWKRNKILSMHTKSYIGKEVLTFGFPHFRNWKYISSLVTSDPDNCSYITNEGKEISQIYMKAKYGILEKRSCYYIVVVKYPFITTRDNYNYGQTSNKRPVYVYEKGDEWLTKVYKISKPLNQGSPTEPEVPTQEEETQIETNL